MKEINLPVKEIEDVIGYTFLDKSLLIQAFTRTSFTNEWQGTPKPQSNEVLEFFGDSALSLSIVTFLISERTERYRFGIFSSLNEGDLSNIRSKLSDKKNLSLAIKSLGLNKYLLVGDGDEKLGIREEASVMEDLFESIVGAIYTDSSYSVSAVMKSVAKMIDLSVYITGNSTPPEQSPKNTLQEWCADKKRRLPPPRYEKIGESGPDHNKTYTVGCFIGEEMISTGKGRNVKTAGAEAAKAAIEILKNE